MTQAEVALVALLTWAVFVARFVRAEPLLRPTGWRAPEPEPLPDLRAVYPARLPRL